MITADILTDALPQYLRQELHEAALNLDVEETEQIIDKIRTIEPNIANNLHELAQHYQFEQLIALSRNYYTDKQIH